MENKLKELLSYDNKEKKQVALNLLFLKYKMVCDNKEEEVNEIDYLSYFCVGRCYKQEIDKLENHFSIKIDVENPFTHEVIKSLEDDNLIKTSTYEGNKGNVKITVPYGVEYLRKFYSEIEIDDEKLTSTIVFNTVNNISIHIGDTINNITNGLSVEDKEFFISILKEYSENKDEKSFTSKLTAFSKRVGEGIFINIISNLFNPENLSKILEKINL